MNQIVKVVLALLLIAFSAGLYAQEATNNHQIRKGDGLSINVMGHPEFSLESVIVMPDGYKSPPSIAAVITLAEAPRTTSFLKEGDTGEWSSNHCACWLIISVR